MASISSQYRLNRLFAPDGKCFDVAIDHGFFNEGSFLSGIEDLRPVVAKLVEAAPDAIQLPPGTAPFLQTIPGKTKPALALRTDIANCYGKQLPEYLYSKLIVDAVEQAVRLDAACVVVNLLKLPDQPELHGECVDNICELKPECERAGMPLMIEPLVMQEIQNLRTKGPTAVEVEQSSTPGRPIVQKVQGRRHQWPVGQGADRAARPVR